ncbi:1-aminocyclopropane-1-carboxylate deaminase/D-cysteine desulfhydrase [Proteiniclasticum sp. C24MP]|uniref:1-aminocyclopropane-1-carboxylate deaminase/D-cysteine desulfhydrase n=1 Tax=Proteiniclasticum sp. C24MP TaxID=3374101 RepID=UPI003754F946
MNQRIREMREILAKVPKVQLGFFPTPLQRLDRLSEKLGVEILLKRDDLSGISQFGGNKIRKLEYLMADALKEEADTVITYGASQSNHAMQTVTACRRLGLHPVLYLTDLIGSDEENPSGNLLLDRILGAEIHLEQPGTGDMMEAEERIREKVKVRIETLKGEGRTCYEIPMGGANAIGSLGFLEAYLELTEDLLRKGQVADYLYHATGTGGTLAGLMAGKTLIQSKTEIVSIGVGIGGEEYKGKVVALSNGAIELLGRKERVLEEDLSVMETYYGEGYEVPSAKGSRAIRLLAETEGILLDPVYTAKAFSGMLDHIEKGIIEKGSRVVFWHTGGATALFAEKKILGDIY